MKKMELLAPAGRKEAFIGAINAGADAVYVAGKRFGARNNADNFTKEELKELIAYAHLRNVLVYVTVNTLVFDEEIGDLLTYTDFLVANHVDAFIIQDLGVLLLLRHRYPNTKLHASTQMNTHSLPQVKMLKKLGVDRIILAREVDIITIRQIREEVDIELEVFVHGALCVSYSGNCLFSAIMSNRSGNRGLCAQSCRMPFSLYKDNKLIVSNKYLLSMKDLMTLEYLKELAGLVDALKIEGRLRSNEYVVQAVKSYRKVLDSKGTIDNIEVENLQKTFNRHFTKGNILKTNDADIFNQERPNHQGIILGRIIAYQKPLLKVELLTELNIGDGIRILGNPDFGFRVDKIFNEHKQIVTKAQMGDTVYLPALVRSSKDSIIVKTSDIKLNQNLAIYFDKSYKLIPLKGKLTLYHGKEITVVLEDDLKNIVCIKGNKVEKAVNQPLTVLDITNHFAKLGATPFYFSELVIDTDDMSFVRFFELNELRRKAVNELSILREKRNEPVINNKSLDTLPITDSLTSGLTIKVATKEQLKIALKYPFINIYCQENLKNNIEDSRVLPYYPRIIKNKRLNTQSLLNDFGDLYDNKNPFLITDKYFNCLNSFAVEILLKHNAKRVVLSDELTVLVIKKVATNFYQRNHFYPPLELVVYGDYELMILKNNPLFQYDFCGSFTLQDAKKNNYQIVTDQENITTIFYQRKDLFKAADFLKTIPNLSFRLELRTENAIESQALIERFLQKFGFDNNL